VNALVFATRDRARAVSSAVAAARFPVCACQTTLARSFFRGRRVELAPCAGTHRHQTLLESAPVSLRDGTWALPVTPGMRSRADDLVIDGDLLREVLRDEREVDDGDVVRARMS